VSIARPRPGIASSWLDCRRTHLCRGQRPRETRSATVIASTATRDCGSGPTRELSDWVSSSDRAFEPPVSHPSGPHISSWIHSVPGRAPLHSSPVHPSRRTCCHHGAAAVVTEHRPDHTQQVRRGNNRCSAATTGAAWQQQVRRRCEGRRSPTRSPISPGPVHPRRFEPSGFVGYSGPALATTGSAGPP
jgi:hypothetical protein